MTSRWQTLRTAAWLGWQLESNWAEPVLFLLYVAVKPLAAAGILLGMLHAAGHAGVTHATGFGPYIAVSIAVYGLVGGITLGMSNCVVTDRESYGMLKYVYIAPVPLRWFILGRGLARGFQTLIGGFITLTAACLVLPELRASVAEQFPHTWGWLFVYLTLGLPMLAGLGLLLAAAVLNMSRNGQFLSEGVASAFYLLSGAVFPIGVLPEPLQWVGMCLPTTYWLEGVRRCLLGPPTTVTPLASWSHAEIAGVLLVSTAGLLAVGDAYFRASERRAWRRGRLDQKSGV